MNNYVSTKANWIIWCMENENGFTMIGSRKVSQLDLEARMEFDNFTNDLFCPPVSACVPTPMNYDLTGSLRGFTMVTAKTEFEAFITLMHTFQQEKQCEKAEGEMIARRIKEEKNRKKVHKKAMKQANEGKFDAAKCPPNCWYCERDLEEAENEYDLGIMRLRSTDVG